MAIDNEFDQEMHSIYVRARKEAKYNASRFLTLLNACGGLETARRLIYSKEVSEGYAALWERGRLDLTVEALIFDNPKYHVLFTDEELRIVQDRLRDYRYTNALS